MTYPRNIADLREQFTAANIPRDPDLDLHVPA